VPSRVSLGDSLLNQGQVDDAGDGRLLLVAAGGGVPQCGQAAKFSGAKTCNATGVADVSSAHNQAAASTVGFIAGAALLGGGAYLYFMAPKAGNLTAGPTVGAGSAGLSLRGIW